MFYTLSYFVGLMMYHNTILLLLLMIYLDKPAPIVGGGRAERSRVQEGETSPKTE